MTPIQKDIFKKLTFNTISQAYEKWLPKRQQKDFNIFPGKEKDEGEENRNMFVKSHFFWSRVRQEEN